MVASIRFLRVIRSRLIILRLRTVIYFVDCEDLGVKWFDLVMNVDITANALILSYLLVTVD